jgi:hypothetical protein
MQSGVAYIIKKQAAHTELPEKIMPLTFNVWSYPHRICTEFPLLNRS